MVPDPNSPAAEDTLTQPAITALLQQWKLGEAGAPADLLPHVYRELRGLARGYMSRERAGHTLQPTALVHEAFLRLSRNPPAEWQDRRHFYGVAARLMRQILVDHARARSAAKRQSDAAPPPASPFPEPRFDADYLSLDAALSLLEREDPRRAQIVELRYFGGLEIEEVASAVRMSASGVKKHLTLAKLWLFERMQPLQP